MTEAKGPFYRPPLPSCRLIEGGCDGRALAASFDLEAPQYHYPQQMTEQKDRELLTTSLSHHVKPPVQTVLR